MTVAGSLTGACAALYVLFYVVHGESSLISCVIILHRRVSLNLKSDFPVFRKSSLTESDSVIFPFSEQIKLGRTHGSVRKFGCSEGTGQKA